MSDFRRRFMSSNKKSETLPGGYTKCNYLQFLNRLAMIVFEKNTLLSTDKLELTILHNLEDYGSIISVGYVTGNYLNFKYDLNIINPEHCYYTLKTLNKSFEISYKHSSSSPIDIIFENLNLKIGRSNTTKVDIDSIFSDDNGRIYPFTIGSFIRESMLSLKVYKCKITRKGKILFDCVPAKNSLGDYGLFDKILNKFYIGINVTGK